MVKYKFIKIKEEVHKKLGKCIERKGESFGDIIDRLIDSYNFNKSKK